MKKYLSTILIVTLLLGILAILVGPASAVYPQPNETALFADPDYKQLTAPGTYTFDVKIQNWTQVQVIAFSLHFDPTYVNITNITPNPKNEFPGASFVIGNWFPSTGYITDITLYTTGAWDITKARSVVRVTVQAYGPIPSPSTTVIDIYGMDCYDAVLNNFLSGDSPYDHTLYFPTPPPTPPTADFTWSPLYPLEGQTAHFDASGSQRGFDGYQYCDITEYRWDWENDGTVDNVTTSPTIDHVFAMEGTYSVNLTVYAPGGPHADPSYVPFDSVVKTVTVKAPPTGRAIDLYTQDTRHPGYTTPYTGQGITGGQVDSFAPQDLVILFAKVTYNNAPVVNKEVAFEVHGPPNPYQNITIYRQAFTNGSGIATVAFRIPWPDEHAEDIVFGNWTIMAKVDIAEQWESDSHWFYVHWIIEIQSLKLLNSTYVPTIEFTRGVDTAYINVTVYNWAMTPRNATITAVIYDELGVPVGTAVMALTGIPGETSVWQIASISIPSWAYVGYGEVYVNAFTKLPWECGVCYCPEQSTVIRIKAP